MSWMPVQSYPWYFWLVMAVAAFVLLVILVVSAAAIIAVCRQRLDPEDTQKPMKHQRGDTSFNPDNHFTRNKY